MATKSDLQRWIVEALEHHGGRAPLVDVARHIWMHHEADLRESDGLFYTWQYDMRWAAQKLRDRGHTPGEGMLEAAAAGAGRSITEVIAIGPR